MTVARGDESEIDALVVVVEHYPRSAEVTRRLLDMAAQKNIGRRIVVANKVADDQDLAFIRQFLAVEPNVVIPVDGAVRTADRFGVSPIDHDRDSPAVGALRELATTLVG